MQFAVLNIVQAGFNDIALQQCKQCYGAEP